MLKRSYVSIINEPDVIEDINPLLETVHPLTSTGGWSAWTSSEEPSETKC